MYREAFKSMEDLNRFDENALLLFALILRFSFDDITAVAADCLTGGSDDKKVDLVLVNPDEGHAVIAQTYIASDEKRKSAPSNKASDLNTAVGWLLAANLEKLPETLKSPAEQLRNAVENRLISDLEIWYVHNLPESSNCSKELETVEHTAAGIISSRYHQEDLISIRAIEVGNETLNEWYQTTQTPILVSDELSFKVPGGFDISGDDWEAISTAVSLKDLHELFKKYEKKIFSANIRDYLGTRKSDSNINYGIKKTAMEDPKQFCVYNNGITAITHKYKFDRKKQELKITGLSIVNGAQTTGSIGTLDDNPTEDSLVAARFIKCNNPTTILNIVRYNNSQNKITATDFRSNDPIQDRLRKEFEQIGDHIYPGGRRGGVEDAIKRQSNLLPSDSVAQALIAFHGYPNIAYNEKSDIWNKDEIYSKVFNEQIHAGHILFAYSLFIAVKEMKLALFRLLKNNEDMLDRDKKRLEFLRLRGANYILIAALARCLELLIERKIPNYFRVSFHHSVKMKKAVELWTNIIDVAIPFCNLLIPPTNRSLRVNNENNEAIETFKSMVEATVSANKEIYTNFASNIVIE